MGIALSHCRSEVNLSLRTLIAVQQPAGPSIPDIGISKVLVCREDVGYFSSTVSSEEVHQSQMQSLSVAVKSI